MPSPDTSCPGVDVAPGAMIQCWFGRAGGMAGLDLRGFSSINNFVVVHVREVWGR